MGTLDVVAAVLRVVVGGTMAVHGWNHMFGPGGLTGTAEWFGSMGLRPPRLHASLSGFGELSAGMALVIGVLTPVASAFVVGTMTVAGVIAHRRNGFFVFRDGYEYVLVLAGVAICVAILGPGWLSLDHALGIDTRFDGRAGGATAAGGVLAALLLLAVCWRPHPREDGNAVA